MEKQPLRCMILHPIYYSDLSALEFAAKKLEEFAKTNNYMFGLMRVGMIMYIIIDVQIDDVDIEIKKYFEKDYILVDATEGMLEGDIKYKISDNTLNPLINFFKSIQEVGKTLKKESGNFQQSINKIKNESDNKPYYEVLSIPKAIDRILDKVGQSGIESLDKGEHEFLTKHSK